MIEDLPVPGESSAPPSGAMPRTAGAMLRAAREREGLHVAVLAATIKVAPAKLEALEQDRYGDLPNATFARALAQSVCRSLKVDPRPVLALLPQADAPPLEGAMGRLNTPFQERSSRGSPVSLTWASKPLFWAGGVLMVAAVAVGLMPSDWIDRLRSQASDVVSALPAASAPASSASAGETALASTVTESVPTPALNASVEPATGAASAPAPASSATAAASTPTPVASAAAPAAAGGGLSLPAPGSTTAAVAAASGPPAGVLRLSATSSSWVEVVDGRGQTVFSRVLQAGEAVGVDGSPPLRLHVGNAPGTAVVFRGEARDLAPYTRGNVARLELR